MQKFKINDWVEFKHRGTESYGKIIAFEKNGYLEVELCDDDLDNISIHVSRITKMEE